MTTRNQLDTRIQNKLDLLEAKMSEFPEHHRYKLAFVDELFRAGRFYESLLFLDTFDLKNFYKASFDLRIRLIKLLVSNFDPDIHDDEHHKKIAENTLPLLLENLPQGLLTDAQKAFNLHNIFLNINFEELAVYCLVKAATLNHAEAQAKLGMYYYKGKYFDKNDALAFEWLSKAAENDNPLALNNIGYFYFKGIATGINYTLAYKYLYAAYLVGETLSLSELGYMLYYGKGVEQDTEKALELWIRGKEYGDPYCKNYLDMVYLTHQKS